MAIPAKSDALIGGGGESSRNAIQIFYLISLKIWAVPKGRCCGAPHQASRAIAILVGPSSFGFFSVGTEKKQFGSSFEEHENKLYKNNR